MEIKDKCLSFFRHVSSRNNKGNLGYKVYSEPHIVTEIYMLHYTPRLKEHKITKYQHTEKLTNKRNTRDS